MPQKIAVFSGTRAEYGLLFWLLQDLHHAADFELQLIVSGAHLSPEYGMTIRQIEQDGLPIGAQVEMLLSSASPVGIAKSLGLAVIGLADHLQRLAPDWLIVLGDRYEALAAAQTALLLHVPVLHIHGGEISEGAYDDEIRHAITKLSYLHATSTERHRQRVIQLGEQPQRVVNCGAPGLDHLQRSTILSRQQLADSLAFKLSQPFFLLTYHPATAGCEDPVQTLQAIIAALDGFDEHQLIVTYPNADEGSRLLIPLLQHWASNQPQRICLVPSLGQQRYLAALKHCQAVIGNSSSGIIEAPSFQVPTVNIGSRQRGREAAASVLHCEPDASAITHCIRQALELDCSKVTNPYGQGDSSARILALLRNPPTGPKRFYDLENIDG